METIRSSISNKGGEIERLKKVLKDMEDEITELKAVINEKYEEKHKGESVVSSKRFFATLVVLNIFNTCFLQSY